VPDPKGKEARGVLTFDDQQKQLQVAPAKRAVVTVPYSAIDKCTYEYTNERRITMTHEKLHWLEIDYHDQGAHKTLILRMEGHDAPRILVALKDHAGVDAEILGNADKRRGGIFH
jgi:hypothetical protein